MTERHTPWELVTEDDPRGQPVPYYRGLVCIVSATPRLSVVTADNSTVEPSTWPEVGKLIAAAPTMLDALVALYAALMSDPPDNGPQKHIVGDTTVYRLDGQAMYTAINAVRAAIAKATA